MVNAIMRVILKVGYLIDYEYFENSGCIKKYFNSTEQKYYDTKDPKFSWPIIAHGTFHKDSIGYR